MTPNDRSANAARQATLGQQFTPVELERLMALRSDFTDHAEYSEYMIDANELEFARWLYEHGRIGERLSEVS